MTADQQAASAEPPVRVSKLGYIGFETPDVVIHDEAKGYWEPRPWHDSYPQYPRTWEVDRATVNSWGPVNERELDH